MANTLDPQITAYLQKLPAGKMQLCEALRALAMGCMPGAVEIIAHGALGYGTSKSSFDRIVYIAPQQNWVNLGFFFGADIPDPTHLLAGTGARMRHIKIKVPEDVHDPAIAAILKAAWAKAPADMEKIHQREK